MRAAYPTAYRGMDEVDHQGVIALWADMFKDDDAKIVAAAVKAFIATDTKGYPPNIGAVKESIAKITRPQNELTEMEAWTMVRGKMSAYATHQDFLDLPKAIQRAVGGSSQLVQWALTDMASLPVIMSNFMRSYRTAIAAEHEYAKLPGDIRAMIGTTGITQNALPLGESAEKEDEE